MKKLGFRATDVSGAIEEILDLVQRDIDAYTIYFHGWDGFGTTAVLRSLPRVLKSMKDPPPGLRFGRILYIDCSTLKSERAMQRKIAEELELLDRKAMAMFDKQDEEDDFNGVDHASRGVIRNVAAVIDQTLRESRFMVILISGTGHEHILSRFGIPEYNSIIIWTIRTRFRTYPIGFPSKKEETVRASIFIYSLWHLSDLTSSQLSALLHEEVAMAVAFQWDIDLTVAIDCLFYWQFLYHGSQNTDWSIRAIDDDDPTNYWICDGIIKEMARANEISTALYPEIADHNTNHYHDIVSSLSGKISAPFLIVEDDDLLDAYGKRTYRWITSRSKNKFASEDEKVQEVMQATLARASSIFLGLGNNIEGPCGLLPNSLFQQCNILGLLILYNCSFSFASPPFLHSQALRFLQLDFCTDNGTTHQLEGENDRSIKWLFLRTLLVLRLRYTELDEILRDEKIDLMANLTELSIEGLRCWQYINQVQDRLPNLQKLRIAKPRRQEEKSTDISNSLMNKSKLKVLDLSGNSYMRNLPTSLSEVSSLEVLVLDHCVGLESVVLTNSPIKSFHFKCSIYGYHEDNKHFITSKISLEGCTQLEKLVLSGPNLVEVDLSGCPIKVLNFATMFWDVPRVKRIFLLGCERLCAITGNPPKKLELLCIDTRPGKVVRPSFEQSKSFQLHIHAITADARLARSLWALINHEKWDVSFNISITSSTAHSGVVQHERRSKEMIEHSDHQHYAVLGLYGDVFSEVGDDAPAPMEAFLQPPAPYLDCHIEVGYGGKNVQSEVERNYDDQNSLGGLMASHTESLHVHDTLARTSMPAADWHFLRWCRVERCPNLETIFPSGAQEQGKLETIWASDLLMARSIWGKSGDVRWGWRPSSSHHFRGLRHLHLRSCPSLWYALPVWSPSFASLETLHIVHCGDLKHVFAMDKEYHRSVEFPKLTTIHLHDLPGLQQICEAPEMVVPLLETIRTRGCWSLRRLPGLKGREPGMRKPTVEMEKDVWDALEWDGVDSRHHPSLYEAPVHSRYYKQRGLLRRTVLR